MSPTSNPFSRWSGLLSSMAATAYSFECSVSMARTGRGFAKGSKLKGRRSGDLNFVRAVLQQKPFRFWREIIKSRNNIKTEGQREVYEIQPTPQITETG